jgi:hypothetical protein
MLLPLVVLARKLLMMDVGQATPNKIIMHASNISAIYAPCLSDNKLCCRSTFILEVILTDYSNITSLLHDCKKFCREMFVRHNPKPMNFGYTFY